MSDRYRGLSLRTGITSDGLPIHVEMRGKCSPLRAGDRRVGLVTGITSDGLPIIGWSRQQCKPGTNKFQKGVRYLGLVTGVTEAGLPIITSWCEICGSGGSGSGSGSASGSGSGSASGSASGSESGSGSASGSGSGTGAPTCCGCETWPETIQASYDCCVGTRTITLTKEIDVTAGCESLAEWPELCGVTQAFKVLYKGSYMSGDLVGSVTDFYCDGTPIGLIETGPTEQATIWLMCIACADRDVWIFRFAGQNLGAGYNKYVQWISPVTLQSCDPLVWGEASDTIVCRNAFDPEPEDANGCCGDTTHGSSCVPCGPPWTAYDNTCEGTGITLNFSE